jgi:metal-responsive CopG/Arc/MetJ family transcriptional regulator
VIEMANSPLVSLRIPAETLEKIDNLAQTLYPARRSGKNPNRSQLILDAIEQFLEQKETARANSDNIEEQISQTLQQYQKHIENQIKEYIDEKFLAYAHNLENRLRTNRKWLEQTSP